MAELAKVTVRVRVVGGAKVSMLTKHTNHHTIQFIT